jgi:palmitoyl transferase
VIVAKRYFLFISFVFIQLAVIPQATAEDKGWFDTFTDNVSETWQQPEHYDLYVPAITWHARFAYDKDKTDRYNERRLGSGIWSVPLG